jgi:hypothetical protein
VRRADAFTVSSLREAKFISNLATGTNVSASTRNEVSDVVCLEIKINLPGFRLSNSAIFASSISGFGPSRSCAASPPRTGVPERGVPERGGVAPREAAAATAVIAGPSPPSRGAGGADIGRVVILSGGSALAAGRGSISSRLTGIPRLIKCCRRVRDRVHVGGTVRVGGSVSVAYNLRLRADNVEHSYRSLRIRKNVPYLSSETRI